MAVAHVQSISGGADGTSFNVTLSSSVTAGNAVIVSTSAWEAVAEGNGIPTVSDNRGNAYSSVTKTAIGNNSNVAVAACICYAVTAAAGGPIQVRPASLTAIAKTAFSERNPYPG